MGSKKYLLYNTLNLLLVFILSFVAGKNNLFIFTLSSSLYLILINFFSHFSIKNLLLKYKSVEYYYTLKKTYKYSLIFIVLVDVVLLWLSLTLGKFIENIFNIVNVKFVFSSMAISLVVIPFINIISDYLIVNRIKFGKYLFNIYNIINFILTLIICNFAYNILKLPNCICISLIFYTKIISFVMVYLFVYLNYIISLNKIPIIKKREELRVNYKKSIVKCLVIKYNLIIEHILQYSFLYISIIFVYYALTYQYGYGFDFTSKVINMTYLYCFNIVYFIIVVILYRNKEKIKKVKNNELNINDYLVKCISNLLPIIIFFIIISKYLWLLIFNNKDGIGILMWSFILILFASVSYILLKLASDGGKKKILIFGLLIKLIITIPLVSSFYRLGYNLIYGDALTNIVSFLGMIIYNIIFIRNKYEFKFLNLLDKILKSIYQNIILCSILIVTQLLLPFTIDNRINSLIIISIYAIVMIIIKLTIKVYLKNKNDLLNR